MTDIGISGTEGFVFYCHLDDGQVRQFKCKPESIEKIHWATGITNESIRTTCQNAFEETDEPTVELIERLLGEEFDAREIEGRRDSIARILDEVRADMKFRREVIDAYRSLGVSLAQDRRAVMRAMSGRFSTQNMRYIYWIVANAG